VDEDGEDVLLIHPDASQVDNGVEYIRDELETYEEYGDEDYGTIKRDCYEEEEKQENEDG